MKTNKNTPLSQKLTEAEAGAIKLGLDIHKYKYVVVMHVDGSAPKRTKSLDQDTSISWIRQQLAQTDEEHSC